MNVCFVNKEIGDLRFDLLDEMISEEVVMIFVTFLSNLRFQRLPFSLKKLWYFGMPRLAGTPSAIANWRHAFSRLPRTEFWLPLIPLKTRLTVLKYANNDYQLITNVRLFSIHKVRQISCSN